MLFLIKKNWFLFFRTNLWRLGLVRDEYIRNRDARVGLLMLLRANAFVLVNHRFVQTSRCSFRT